MTFLLARMSLALALTMVTSSAVSQSLPFAEARWAGGLLFLSGQIGIKPNADRAVDGGIEAETAQTMENVGAILRKRGLGFDDLVKCTVMLTDMAEWSRFNRAYAARFPSGRYPARSAFAVPALALGAKVEVECVAQARIATGGDRRRAGGQ